MECPTAVPSCLWSLLCQNTCLHVFSYLEPADVCRAASVSKAFRDTANNRAVWHALLARQEARGELVAKLPDTWRCPSTSVEALRRACHNSFCLRKLPHAEWERLLPSQPRPCAREGLAAAAWGDDGMMLFGGWGQGIRNDLFFLSGGPNQSQELSWRVPKVLGRKPAVRYGHSLTRVGPPGHEKLVVYGGMQAGGYQAEIASLAVLQPLRRPAASAAGGAAGCSLYTAPEDEAACEYEWLHPHLTGDDPVARGYHSACVSTDGTKLYLFGGIADHGSITDLVSVDVATWRVTRLVTSGKPPGPRFGNSLVEWHGRLLVIGGGIGSDLARSGHDLRDIYALDLSTMEWSQCTATNSPSHTNVMGRCHASTLVGSHLVLFGGSLRLGNALTLLDLDTLTWRAPQVHGKAPGKRMSAVMVRRRDELLVFGGWIYSEGEMGDLHRVKLVFSVEETQVLAQRAEAAAQAGPSGSRQSARLAERRRRSSSAASGGACGRAGVRRSGFWGRGGDGSDDGSDSDDPMDTEDDDGDAAGAGVSSGAFERLAERLSEQMARYYGLMREIQGLCEAGETVPLGLVGEMQECVTAIRALRATSSASTQARALIHSWLGLDEEEDEEEDEEGKEEEEEEEDEEGKEEEEEEESEEDMKENDKDEGKDDDAEEEEEEDGADGTLGEEQEIDDDSDKDGVDALGSSSSSGVSSSGDKSSTDVDQDGFSYLLATMQAAVDGLAEVEHVNASRGTRVEQQNVAQEEKVEEEGMQAGEPIAADSVSKGDDATENTHDKCPDVPDVPDVANLSGPGAHHPACAAAPAAPGGDIAAEEFPPGST